MMNIEVDEPLHLTGFTILCVVALIVEVMFEIVMYLTIGFNMLIIIFICLNILTFVLLILTMYNNKNVDIETIKSKGEKIKAYIIEAGTTNKRRQAGTYSYLYVRYNKNKMKIVVKNNKIFKILKLLFKPYPIDKRIEIPVDMYIYKGNRYVDLENINFSEIEGYSEAKKIIEEMEKKDD